MVAVGPGAHKKHQFRVGDHVEGLSLPVPEEKAREEVAGLYKASGIEVYGRGEGRPDPEKGPPFRGIPPTLPEYRQRGHIRLDPKTYEAKCATCMWGCKMPTDIIIDHWNRSRGPDNVQWRMETFCYGDKSCPFYKAGPKRKVQGRKAYMVFEDDGSTRE